MGECSVGWRYWRWANLSPCCACDTRQGHAPEQTNEGGDVVGCPGWCGGARFVRGAAATTPAHDVQTARPALRLDYIKDKSHKYYDG